MATNNVTTYPSAVAGHFSSRAQAEQAIAGLRDAGFTMAEIRIAEDPSDQIAALEASRGSREWQTPDRAIAPNLRKAAPYITSPGLGHAGLPDEPDSYTDDWVNDPGDFASSDHGVTVSVSAPGRMRAAEFILQTNGAEWQAQYY